MSEVKITPELVVQRYRELGIKPATKRLGIISVPGCPNWDYDGLGCCAMGIALVGKPVSPRQMGPGMADLGAVGHQLGIDFQNFYLGFDLEEEWVEQHIPAAYSVVRSSDDYLLGKACREAVIAAGYTL